MPASFPVFNQGLSFNQPRLAAFQFQNLFLPRRILVLAGFRRADLNNDGKVTLDEALTHGKRMFQFHDKNKDGVITRDEVASWCGCFAQADTNNDGKDTYAEHEAMLRARFVLMDKNKDAVLSGDELMRGQRGGRGRCWQ